MIEPLQTRLKLTFSKTGSKVVESMMKDLLSFSFADKETDEADEIDITLKDEKGKWAKSWKSDDVEKVEASIISGTTTETGKRLYCGRFYIDSRSVSGSPRTYNIKAVSIPLSSAIRKKVKSKAWEEKSLEDIAVEIGRDNKLSVLYDSDYEITYDRIDQNRESDLKFLSKLCKDEGLSLKVTDEKIVIFDQESYEKKKPVKTLTLGKSDILSWNFSSEHSEKYKSVTVAYRDPKKKRRGRRSKKKEEVPTYTYTDADADENGQEFAYKTRAKSLDEAKRKAKAKLRYLNMRSLTGSLTVIGDPSLVAGVVIACKGFGSFDGNFLVQEATHSVGSSGYTTELSLRRVNKNY